MSPGEREEQKLNAPNRPFSSRVDLITAARHYVNFLKKTRCLRHYLFNHPQTLNAAIVRYESLWLPLVERYQTVSNDTLLPPLDIHIVWVLHMLTGQGYVVYCKKRFRRIIDHAFFLDQNEAARNTEQLWKQRYPDETFRLKADASSVYSCPYNSDLQEILKLEKQASDQWMLPHFTDDVFIESASRRYQKFIELQDLHSGETLVPTLDIQLLWWTHMLHPDRYHKDITHYCNKYVSFVEVHRAAVQEDYGEVWDNTEALFQLYHDDFQLPGTRLYPWPQDVLTGNVASEYEPNITEEIMEISLDKLHVSNVFTHEKDLIIEARRLGQSSASYEPMFRMKAHINTELDINPAEGVGTVHIDLRRHRGIEIVIYGKRGRCCISSERHIATLLFDPRQLFGNLGPRGVDTQVEIPRVYGMDPTVRFQCRARLHEKRAPFELSLNRDQFSPLPMPADFRAFVEHLEWWMHADFLSTSSFASAMHSVHMRSQSLNLSCQVVCSTQSHLSMISVSHQRQGRLTLAFTVGEDMLPDYVQVDSSFPLSVDSQQGDTAMVVRSHIGIWGVCVARKNPARGSGSITVDFYNTSSQAYYCCQVEFPDKTSFSVGEATVDLRTGLVTLAPGCSELAEYLTLAFCVSNMYAKMCGNVDNNANFLDVTQHLGTASLSRYFKFKGGRPQSAPGSLRGSVASRQGTASRLTSKSRKRQSMLCTMLLACGLRASAYYTDGLQDGKAMTSQISLVSDTSMGSGVYLNVPKMRFQPQTGYSSYANLNREYLSVPEEVMHSPSKSDVADEVSTSAPDAIIVPESATEGGTTLENANRVENANREDETSRKSESTPSRSASVTSGPSRRTSVKSGTGWERMDSFINDAFAQLDEYEYEINFEDEDNTQTIAEAQHSTNVTNLTKSEDTFVAAESERKDSVSATMPDTKLTPDITDVRAHLLHTDVATRQPQIEPLSTGINLSDTVTASSSVDNRDADNLSQEPLVDHVHIINQKNNIRTGDSLMNESRTAIPEPARSKHIKSKSETFIVTQALVHCEPSELEHSEFGKRKMSVNDSDILVVRL